MGNDMQTQNRVPMAFATYVGWALVTIFAGKLLAGGEPTTLADSVSHGISWNIAAALLLLLIVTAVMRWRDLGFVAPTPLGSLKLLWFPALYLVIFSVMAVAIGLPASSVMIYVFLNTLIVGFSEEIMFRGVMFRALLGKLSIWPAMILTTVLFGGVHVLNVIMTGQLGEAMVQSVAAAMSGFLFMALLIRTGSLWVPIIYHALWDFCTFMLSVGAESGGGEEALAPGLRILIPVLLVTPNFLYALFLLRKVRNGSVPTGEARQSA